MNDRLYLRIARDSLDAITYAPDADTVAVMHRDVDPAAEPATAIADIIYDTPALMPGTHASVTVLTDTPARAIIPGAVTDTDLQRDILTLGDTAGVIPDDPAYLDAEARGTGTRFAFAIPAPLAGYLRRTYDTPLIVPALLPLVEYYCSRSHLLPDTHCYVNLRGDDIDIVVTANGTPRLANTYAAPDDADAIYYIFAACRCAGLSSDADTRDTISLSGDRSRRERLMPLLRARHPRVMPVIFPPALYRAGADITAAPFDLTAAVALHLHQ